MLQRLRGRVGLHHRVAMRDSLLLTPHFYRLLELRVRLLGLIDLDDLTGACWRWECC
uniref:Uncharacterized protein n=1 Tax=Utricularia reniformis TaxID=192314 RepID=A0A1Y0B4J8_9LAMI|nr:hypothetical protein AEK19_MT2158 [Utricularia reniformis]ART32307.1 hypothetical protein AEK19_MT2158 [Utricularia reniformis]